MHNADADRGGDSLDRLRDSAIANDYARDHVTKIFDPNTTIIRWIRLTSFQLLSLMELVQVMLSLQQNARKDILLKVVNDTKLLKLESLAFKRAPIIYILSMNDGVEALVQELKDVAGVKYPGAIETRTWQRPGDTPLLLYLNSALFKEPLLADQIRLALGRGIVLAHENDFQRQGCEFKTIIDQTPRDLLDKDLYSDVAIPLFGGKLHRELGLKMVLRQLGGDKLTRTSSMRMLLNEASTIRSASSRNVFRTNAFPVADPDVEMVVSSTGSTVAMASGSGSGNKGELQSF